ncbi:aminotransferase class IV [Jiangella gansuensis]|uniref:aminotransferase class IV n=1 Tax=Jiangella gansuensis TaxID=281473 RepID=UPI00047B1D25|nr:aminotransferase class IV [Jiangella gansuensis]
MAQLNGKPIGVEQLKALALVPYGHFTSMRVDGAGVRGLSLHLKRLVKDCETLFGTTLDPQRLRDLARMALPSPSCVLRLTIFDPGIDLGHPATATDPHVLVTARPAARATPPPLRVQTRRYVRDLPQVKSVGLFGTLFHRRAAQQNGFDDALFLDERSCVSEGGTWNVGFIHDDEVIWPQAECLAGVTMRLLQDACAHRLSPIQHSDIRRMSAAFATNAAIGVRPIASIDDTAMSPTHPKITALQRAYVSVPNEPL